MKVILILWGTVNALCAARLAHIALVNPVLMFLMPAFARFVRLRHQWFDSLLPSFALHVCLSLAHIAVFIIVANWFSLGMAVICSSMLFLHWALFSYFRIQRFAQPIDQPEIPRRFPFYLPARVAFAAISSVTALGYLGVWYAPAIVFVAWFAYGYGCAELAIRSYVKRRGCERRLAVFVMNQNQGRVMAFRQRYPFP